jgi:hypothetical protein
MSRRQQRKCRGVNNPQVLDSSHFTVGGDDCICILIFTHFTWEEFGQHRMFEVVDDTLQLTSTGTVEAGSSIGEQVLENRIIGLHIWTRHDLVCAGSYSAVRLCCPHLSHTLDDLDCNLLISGRCQCLCIDEWMVRHARRRDTDASCVYRQHKVIHNSFPDQNIPRDVAASSMPIP